MADAPELQRYSVSLVTQGSHRFYTLTMPSDVLARTCFVTTRNEDPKVGFQRVLDIERAKQIASYIDSGFGTIPSSIVLSAQPEAELKIIGGGKTIEFRDTPKAFLVLDGQHRVYGFALASTALRVPVVIYNKLSRQDETRLFIDINTKQRPVPNELLLDIKRLADYENDSERVLSAIFDMFAEQADSPLIGLMSSATRSAGKLSRVTFNAAVKPLLSLFGDADDEGIYTTIAAYIRALSNAAAERSLEINLTNATLFRAIFMLFPDIARRVKDRFGSNYTVENFRDVLTPMFTRLKNATFSKPGNSHTLLHDTLVKALETDFTL